MIRTSSSTVLALSLLTMQSEEQENAQHEAQTIVSLSFFLFFSFSLSLVPRCFLSLSSFYLLRCAQLELPSHTPQLSSQGHERKTEKERKSERKQPLCYEERERIDVTEEKGRRRRTSKR